MAFSLTTTAQNLVDQVNVKKNIILEIDGIPYVFGAVGIQKIWEIGDDAEIGQEGLTIGGKLGLPNSLPWISIQGTTSQIKNQLLQDKGGSGSVSSVKIRLIDKNEFLTDIFAPGDTIPDILAANADVYLGFLEGSHPEDSIKIFNGTISDIEFGAGYVDVTISHPEQLKRQILFEITESETSASITDADTIIPVDNADNFPVIAGVRTYVIIEDEAIEYTGTTSTTLTGCVRGQLNTIAGSHDIDTAVELVYRFEKEAIQGSLELLMSTSGVFETQAATDFNQVTAILNVPNTIAFDDVNIQQTLGLVVGDLISTSGATNGANNVTDKAISGFGTTDTGSYIVVSDVTFVDEVGTSASVTFKSKYDVLGIGCGLNPKQVDVAEFELLETIFASNIADYDYYIKEEISAKEFIDEKLFYPSGFYSIPRKGKVSLGFTAPPLEVEETKTLDETNVLNPDKLRIRRSTNRLFYNAVIYKYNEDIIEDKFLSGNITKSERSENRIPLGNRPLIIEAGGIRNTPANQTFLERQASRFLDRYQFGAEQITVEVNYKTGFNLEVGDTVIFGTPNLKVSDSTVGSRKFQPRIMEVTNTSLGITSGKISLELTDTAFSLDGRYGTISPSSFVDSGATTTRIPLKKSFSTGALNEENEKWQLYIGQKILVRTYNWSTQEETTFNGFDFTDVNTMLVDALSSAPSEDYVVDVPNYDDSSADAMARWKRAHCFYTPQLTVVSGVSTTEFTVSALDATKVFNGAFIRVHNSDYSIDSGDVEVTSVAGVNIIVNTDLGFTPSAGQLVDLVGFIDEGEPYRWL